jgi:uncharacterized protein YbaP (TraB family)
VVVADAFNTTPRNDALHDLRDGERERRATPRAMRARTAAALLALLALTAAVAVAGCKKNEEAPAATARDAAVASDAAADKTAEYLPRPFLWKVEKAGTVNYVFGTMHLGVDADRTLPPSLWAVFDSAKAFAMEADATDANLVSAIMRTDGTTLDQELGPAYWAKLEKVVTPRMAAGVKGMKPSAVAVLVTLQGLPMTAPMDLVMASRAKQAGRPVTYLEDARMQQALVDKWMDVRALKAMLDDPDAVRAKNEELLATYKAGDDAKLADLISDQTQWKEMGLSPRDAVKAMDEMLYARNRAWIAPLETLFAPGGAFVAVGVGHLVGQQNVLELLGKKGYTITRVTTP